MIRTGQNREYCWCQFGEDISANVYKLVVDNHIGSHLCITSFDSGPLLPSQKEIDSGWLKAGSVMMSPEITDTFDPPYDQYDEWYLVDTKVFPQTEPEVFVNYAGFYLETKATLELDRDATWDKHSLDYLEPLQERFWDQLRSVSPITYLAVGDLATVVSIRKDFVDLVVRTSVYGND